MQISPEGARTKDIIPARAMPLPYTGWMACAVPTAFLRRAVIVWKQEFSAWASQASIEELCLSFTAQDKVLLVKHSWNGRKFQSKHGKEELCCARGWATLNWKGRGNNEQRTQQKQEDEFSSCRQCFTSEIRQNNWVLFSLVWSPTREL